MGCAGDVGRDGRGSSSDVRSAGGMTDIVLVALSSEQATGATIEGWGLDAGNGRETAGNSGNRGTGMAIADVESAGADSSRSADVGDGGRDDAAALEAPGGTTRIVLVALGSE